MTMDFSMIGSVENRQWIPNLNSPLGSLGSRKNCSAFTKRDFFARFGRKVHCSSRGLCCTEWTNHPKRPKNPTSRMCCNFCKYLASLSSEFWKGIHCWFSHLDHPVSALHIRQCAWVWEPPLQEQWNHILKTSEVLRSSKWSLHLTQQKMPLQCCVLVNRAQGVVSTVLSLEACENHGATCSNSTWQLAKKTKKCGCFHKIGTYPLAEYSLQTKDGPQEMERN